MDSRLRGNDSMAQELIPIGIMANFSKKRLHLSVGSDTIHNIRGFLSEGL
jgi:hypothetical protein